MKENTDYFYIQLLMYQDSDGVGKKQGMGNPNCG